MAEIRVENLHKSFGDFAAVKNSNFTVGDGEFFVAHRLDFRADEETLDVEADRNHPTKRFRPIAAGVVPVPLAYGLAAVLGVAALVIAWFVTPNLAIVIAVYLAMQLAYCFGLKHQAVLDICIVSSAYLIRAIAGGAAAGIPLSQWFLLVMAFGSLFMAAGKRYAELQLAERTGAKIRKSLESYTASYLRFVWTLAATSVVLCYALFAFERDQGSASWWAICLRMRAIWASITAARAAAS